MFDLHRRFHFSVYLTMASTGNMANTGFAGLGMSCLGHVFHLGVTQGIGGSFAGGSLPPSLGGRSSGKSPGRNASNALKDWPCPSEHRRKLKAPASVQTWQRQWIAPGTPP